MRRLAAILYLILIPITFPYLGVEGIKVTIRMAWKAISGARGKRPNSPEEPDVTQQAA